MILLNGFYDNGKIRIDEKNPPHTKGKVRILMDEKVVETSKEDLETYFGRFQFDMKGFRFNREEANER